MRSRLILLSLGLVLGGLVSYGAVWADGLRTDLVDESGMGSVKVEQTDVAAPYVFEVSDLCVDGVEPATITRVKPVHSKGSAGRVNVDEFNLGPANGMPSQWQKLKPGEKLDDWYEANRVEKDPSDRINLPCGPSRYERRTLTVLLEVSEPSTALQAVLIDYKVKGVTKTLRSNVGMALCRGDEDLRDALARGVEDADDAEDENVLMRCFDAES